MLSTPLNTAPPGIPVRALTPDDLHQLARNLRVSLVQLVLCRLSLSITLPASRRVLKLAAELEHAADRIERASTPKPPKTRKLWTEEFTATCQAQLAAGMEDDAIARAHGLTTKQVGNAIGRKILIRDRKKPGVKKCFVIEAGDGVSGKTNDIGVLPRVDG